ncbi:MAG: biotin carboxylase [Gammaproteobacteria bacterium]
MARTKLNGLSEIYTFFRKNTTPIYFVSPTAYNILGIDQWVNNFEYINYFDSFDGYHPRVFIPDTSGPPEFRSMEDVNNYLLDHKDVIAHFKKRGGKGKLLLVMFDEETEDLAKDLGVEIALPSCALRKRLDSKIETTRLGNEAGVPSVPNIMGKADSYDALMKLAKKAKLGDNLVVQTPYGDSGRTTFFIRSKDDWDKNADKMKDEQLKVMKYVNHLPGTVEAVATRHGTLVGPVQTDITGFQELTPYKGGWCGNDVASSLLPPRVRNKVREMVKALGDRLYEEGYRGCFCTDYLLDTDTGDVYLGELNPRISGASPLTHLTTSKYGGAPLMMFHLLEFMDVDYRFSLNAVQRRWAEFDNWSQLVLKQVEDKVELITKAPASGVWRMNDDGEIEFVRRTLDWHTVGDENEAFYLRVYGTGEYRYHGADMGILVSRGRMQTDDRQLTERAKRWATAINGQFEGTPPLPEQPVEPPEWSGSKMF